MLLHDTTFNADVLNTYVCMKHIGQVDFFMFLVDFKFTCL